MSDLLVQIIGLISVFAACLTIWRAYDMLRCDATILFECWLALPLGDKSALFLTLCLRELGEFLPQYGAVSRHSAACLPKQPNSCHSLFMEFCFSSTSGCDLWMVMPLVPWLPWLFPSQPLQTCYSENSTSDDLKAHSQTRPKDILGTAQRNSAGLCVSGASGFSGNLSGIPFMPSLYLLSIMSVSSAW